MAVHVHHDLLFEYCHDYQERADYIKQNKPKNEIEVRLKRFVMLTKAQVAILPAQFVKACQKFDEVIQKYGEVIQKYGEAIQKRNEANQKRNEANQNYVKAWKNCQPQLEYIHKQICGCKEWNGKELVF